MPIVIKEFVIIGFQIKKNNWRQKHQELVSAIRDARKFQSSLKRGGRLPPPPAAAVNAGKYTFIAV